MGLIDSLRPAPAPEQVVREHGPKVARQLRRIFGPDADIDDVYQAAFVEILRSLPRFRGHAKLGTWIHRIVLNVAYQEMRMCYRERANRSSEAFEPDDLPGAQGLSPEARAQLTRIYGALHDLDPKKRIAVILHDLEGHTLKETAELLGRPLQTVASQVQAGRAVLAARFRSPAVEGEGTPASSRIGDRA